jgi:DNA-binding transcriptional LysR family regulator
VRRIYKASGKSLRGSTKPGQLQGSIVAFVRVAKLGSFANAGKVLGISASAVSKSVARLEGRLGLRLFQRTTRALSLTEDGRTFLERCERILDELDDAEREMQAHSANPAGVLKVEFPAALGRLKIAPALGQLTRRYPDLRVEASSSDHLTDPIAAGLDAVVRIGEPRDERLMARRAGTVRYRLRGAILRFGAWRTAHPGRSEGFRLRPKGATGRQRPCPLEVFLAAEWKAVRSGGDRNADLRQQRRHPGRRSRRCRARPAP